MSELREAQTGFWKSKVLQSGILGGKTFSFRFRRLLDVIIFKWIWTFFTLTNISKTEKAFHGKGSKILSAAGCFCGLQSSLLNRKLLLRVFGCDSGRKKVSAAFQRRGRNPLIQFMPPSPPPSPLLDLQPNTPIHLWATSGGEFVYCEQ